SSNATSTATALPQSHFKAKSLFIKCMCTSAASSRGPGELSPQISERDHQAPMRPAGRIKHARQTKTDGPPKLGITHGFNRPRDGTADSTHRPELSISI
ncbi:hypothetical protein, partial [Xanthobacter autotrophicus]|uniref:hypothetical protein n=1 Tax=Xanthobacter autotrophicus TaxID=280 RepID=UPI003728A561